MVCLQCRLLTVWAAHSLCCPQSVLDFIVSESHIGFDTLFYSGGYTRVKTCVLLCKGGHRITWCHVNLYLSLRPSTPPHARILCSLVLSLKDISVSILWGFSVWHSSNWNLWEGKFFHSGNVTCPAQRCFGLHWFDASDFDSFQDSYICDEVTPIDKRWRSWLKGSIRLL